MSEDGREERESTKSSISKTYLLHRKLKVHTCLDQEHLALHFQS